MRREEIDRLLARLSSGEIRPEERAALYDAALEDQALFEEMFAEEALAEALSDEQLRDEFLIREAGRQSVEAGLEVATGSMAAGSPRVVRMPEPVRAMKRRIPWWGWAAPAAVAASTVIAILLFSGPGRDVEVAQTKSDKAVEVAQAQAEKPKPEAAAAPPPVAVGAAKRIAVQEDKARQVAGSPGGRNEIAETLKKSEPVLMARSDEAKAVDLKDQAMPGRPNELPAKAVAAAAPSAAAAPVRADLGATAAGVRAAEAETRPAPAQVAEFRAAAPPPQAEGRVARDAARSEAVVQDRAKTVAAERDEALALRSSAALQVQDASGAWLDLAPGGRAPRGAKLRVKVTAHESGAWTLAGDGGPTVQLAQNEAAFLDLPAQAPGLNRVELTFRPGSPAVMRMRAVTEAGRAGKISIPFTIE